MEGLILRVNTMYMLFCFCKRVLAGSKGLRGLGFRIASTDLGRAMDGLSPDCINECESIIVYVWPLSLIGTN